MLNGLVHFAIVVADAEEALMLRREAFELPLLFRKVLDAQAVRLPQIGCGQVHVQPAPLLHSLHPLPQANPGVLVEIPADQGPAA